MNTEARLARIESQLETALGMLQRLDDRPVEDKYLTVKQAAKEFGLSPTTLYRLKSVQVRAGRAVRISRRKLTRYLQVS